MASLMSILQQAGFKGDGLKMAYAIVMAESGGRANAKNSVGNSAGVDRGLFQINSYYHSEVSDAQAFDALANAKAAYRISNGGKNWTQWTTYNSGAYKKFYGGSGGANVTGGGGGSTYGVSAVTPTIDRQTLMEQYGLTAAIINGNSEIRNLFNKGVAEGWDADLFTARLKNTKWWKTTSDDARKFFLLKTGDPATYKQKYREAMFTLNKMAVDVGLGNQITTKGTATSVLNNAIMYSMRDAWSDARVKAYFGSMVGMQHGGMSGEAGDAYDQLFQLAYANGQKFSASWYTKNIRNVVSGRTTLQALETSVRALAAAKYSSFADQIRAGQNVMDLAQPYISSVAQILEVPSTDVDLNNRWVAKAMTAKQTTGLTTGAQYPLWQFENDLRSDPLWKQTNNARESMFSVAHKVAQDWGFAS